MNHTELFRHKDYEEDRLEADYYPEDRDHKPRVVICCYDKTTGNQAGVFLNEEEAIRLMIGLAKGITLIKESTHA